MNAAKMKTETRAARSVSERAIATGSRRALDSEALDVLVRPRWIEGLAHHHEGLGRGRRRSEAHLLHHLRRVSSEIDFLRHLGVIDIALELTPALHLGHDPDRKR